MTDDHHDAEETRSRTLREADRAVSRRTALGVGGAVGAAGILAWLMGPDLADIFAPEDETESAAEGPGDSVWSMEVEANQRIAENQPTLRPSFEYEPVAVRADRNDSRISAIGAEPAAEESGDRVLVTAEESWLSTLETLLIARFTTGEPIGSQEITIEESSVTVQILTREERWMGVGRYDAPNLDEKAVLLIARSTSRETLREIIEAYPDRYGQLQPL